MICSVLERDPILGKSLDGIGIEINDIDVWLVQHLIVVTLQGTPLRQDGTWEFDRRYEVSLLGVRDASASLLNPEVVCLTVRAKVNEDLRKVCYAEAKRSCLPQCLIVGLYLLIGESEDRLGGCGQRQSSNREPPLSKQSRIEHLPVFLLCS